MKNINVDGKYLQEALELRKEINEGTKTWNDFAVLRQSYGMGCYNTDNIRRGCLLFDEFSAGGWISPPRSVIIPSKTESSEFLSNGDIVSDKLINLKPFELNDPEAILKAHGYDPSLFELVSAKNSVWTVQKANAEKQCYSSRITARPIKNGLNLEEVKKTFENFKPAYNRRCDFYTNYRKNGELLVPCFYDLHFGRLCEESTTGEKYDLETAKNRILKNVDKYLSKFRDRYFDKIVLPIGQDFFNSSTNGYTSSGRHKQDNCASFREIFKKGSELAIEMIERFASLAPVEVIGVEGNHDREESVILVYLLEAYFRNDNRVSVDSRPLTRKYVKFGNSCIGLTHGSDEGDRIFGLMQAEAKEEYANSTSHVWLTGHVHHTAVEEKNGIEVWSVSTITGNDMWTVKTGYVAQKRTMGFIFDKQEGLIENHYFYI